MNVRDLEGGYIVLSGKQLLATLAGAIVFVLIVAGARGARDPKEVKLLDHGYDLAKNYVLTPGDEPINIGVVNDKWTAPICNTSPKDFGISYMDLRTAFHYGILYSNGTRQTLVFDKAKNTWEYQDAPENKTMVTPNNCERILVYKETGGVNHRIHVSLVKR